ncbi:TetR/AcrR family transcriptional regulator [Williamsia sp. MIQD14]|uniref:TetR/AcrR family transcriptional regulator n=1 Tax=Williamsia sp. MIQD14 TaxID=3425703 RepID=UPI003DA03450
MATRTRMTPEQRRDQLLDLGAELFASHPYDEVHIERVAELAKVSRGLLYHYFPSKRDFFVALLARENAALMDETAPDVHLTPAEQLRRGVEAFLDHCVGHEFGVRAVFRGAVSSDPDIVAIIADSIDRQVERILIATGAPATPAPMLVLALRSWIYQVRAASYEMLSDKRASPDDVTRMLMAAFVGTISGLSPEVVPPAMAAVLGTLVTPR